MSASPTPPRASADKSEVAKLRAELRSMQQGMRHMNRRQTNLAGMVQARPERDQPRPEETSPSSSPERPDNTPTDSRDSRAQLADQLAVLETELGTGGDDRWSRWAEGELTQIADDNSKLGVESVEVACGKSLCRMKLAFPDKANVTTAMRDLPGMVPWDAQGFFHVDPNGNDAVVYISREGVALPRGG